jgi:hypothetical protein
MLHGQAIEITLSSFACLWLLWSYPIATLCTNNKKNDESIKRLQCKKKKAKKAGPSLDVYMLGYHAFHPSLDVYMLRYHAKKA